jgi:zinc and cadmium transporter
MTLISILVGTLIAGMGSVWLAALLAYALLSRFTQHLLSLAAGALLATAFTRLLPEAFELSVESGGSAQALFSVLLVGLVFFFLLDKAELWHHGHEHGHDHGEHHHHGHNHHHSHPSGGWAVLLGDSVHAFGDGILIAAAFVADPRLGVAAALAVMAHEVPHHVGDLVVLRQSLNDARAALFRLSLAGGVTAIGGVVGYGFAFVKSQQSSCRSHAVGRHVGVGITGFRGFAPRPAPPAGKPIPRAKPRNCAPTCGCDRFGRCYPALGHLFSAWPSALGGGG